jgi:hypothetical protein
MVLLLDWNQHGLNGVTALWFDAKSFLRAVLIVGRINLKHTKVIGAAATFRFSFWS